MDEKVLEELEFHQETVSTDANSPLHLIREKEMEITGRVLTAKREAEDIVAAARKKAVETLHKAEEESELLVVDRQKVVLTEVQREIELLGESADVEIESLKRQAAERYSQAAKHVVGTVTSV